MSKRHDAVPGASVPMSRDPGGGDGERRFLRAAHPVLQVAAPGLQLPRLLHSQPAHLHCCTSSHLHS